MISGTTAPLTPRQRLILDWVGAYTVEHGIPPSYRDIAHGMGMKSHSTAQHHLNTLQQLGHVRWIKGRHCTLEFFHPDGTWHSTPPPKIL